MRYEQIGESEYRYTDRRNRSWKVWRQATHGVDQWAIKCEDEGMEMFDDAYPTRTSAVRQIQYLSFEHNEIHERHQNARGRK